MLSKCVSLERLTYANERYSITLMLAQLLAWFRCGQQIAVGMAPADLF
jgi:hypothetical protein